MIKHPSLDRIVRTIVTAMHPERIVLFGSRARGNAHEDSDIDLLIEMDTALKKPYREMEIDKLFGLRDWSMDVFVYTPDEVRRMRHDVGTIVHVAEEEGEVLYERP